RSNASRADRPRALAGSAGCSSRTVDRRWQLSEPAAAPLHQELGREQRNGGASRPRRIWLPSDTLLRARDVASASHQREWEPLATRRRARLAIKTQYIR